MYKKAISGVFGLMLLLVGCSSSEPESDVDQNAPLDSESVAADEPSPDPSMIETPEQLETPEPEEVPEDNSGPVISDRGNLVKEIGELGGVVNEAEEFLISFIVSDIDADFDCTTDFADKPENGKFVGLKFEVTTDSSLADEAEPSFWLSPYDFSAWDEDGKRVNDPVGAALVCISDSEALPSPMGPGEVAEGWIVLDLPENAAAAGFGILTAEGMGGWEWKIEN